MYNIPDDFNKDVLVGLAVQQISFASNNIVIGFSPNSYLQIECKFALTNNGVENHYDANELTETAGLLKLLDKKVSKVSFQNNDLTVVYEGGNSLTIFPEENYESYFIVVDSVQTII